MKKVFTTLGLMAFTGSCALFYFLYRFKRSEKKIKKEENIIQELKDSCAHNSTTKVTTTEENTYHIEELANTEECNIEDNNPSNTYSSLDFSKNESCTQNYSSDIIVQDCSISSYTDISSLAVSKNAIKNSLSHSYNITDELSSISLNQDLVNAEDKDNSIKYIQENLNSIVNAKEYELNMLIKDTELNNEAKSDKSSISAVKKVSNESIMDTKEKDVSINDSQIDPNENVQTEKSKRKKQRKKKQNSSVVKDANTDETISGKQNTHNSQGNDNLDNAQSALDSNTVLASSNNNGAQEPLCTSDLEREATPEQEIAASDSHSSVSQGSFDSGQGSIEVEPETVFTNMVLHSTNVNDQYIFYNFEIPKNLVGRLIGKKGSFINKVKASTSANIVVLEHSKGEMNLCSIEGKRSNVIKGLEMIRQHFPLDQFPEVTLAQLNSPNPSPQHQPQMNREILQVELPPGVVNEVQASAIISTGEVWLQQPLHPTYSALHRLHQCMNLNYGDGTSSPIVPLPIQPYTICVCQIGGQWLRCQVTEHDQTMSTVTLLDIGGILNIPVNLLRQIRVDYISLPFQASHCFLHGIEPINDNGWSEEGRAALEELIKNNIIFAAIAAYSQEGIPLVNLYKRSFNQYTFINEKLVEMGYAKWISAPDLT